MEVFEPIRNAQFPGYSVSNLGRVFNHNTRRYLKGGLAGGSHRQVLLRNQEGEKVFKYIHRLVLDTFRPNHSPFYDRVDHINRSSQSNHLGNLRWSNSVLNALNNNAKNICRVGDRYLVNFCCIGQKSRTWFESLAEAEHFVTVEKERLKSQTALLYRALNHSLM